MVRTLARVAVLLAGLTLLAATAGPATASSPGLAQASPSCAVASDADFNGDGRNDLVMGDPSNGPNHGGAVTVLYGGPDGRIASGAVDRLSQGMPGVGGASEDGDFFGQVLTTGHLDADGCLDLVVGAPQEAVGSAAGAGAAYVVFGSPAGLGRGRAGVVLARGQGGVPGRPEAFAHFGSALHAARSPGSTGGAVAIGEFDRTLERNALIHLSAGTVTVVSFNANATVKLARVFSQDTPGVEGGSEQADSFGFSVALGLVGGGASRLDLIVGAPGEGIGSIKDGGNVTVIYDAFAATASFKSATVRQGAGGVPGGAEANDRFGWRLAYAQSGGTGHLAVGVPFEDVGTAGNSGVVQPFSTTNGGLVPRAQVTQGTGGAPGGVEPGDRFGEAVALAGPPLASAGAILAVGVPSEDLNGMQDAGLLQTFQLPATTHLRTVDEDFPGGFGVGAGRSFGYSVAGARTAAESVLIAGSPNPSASGLLGLILFPTNGGTARTVTTTDLPPSVGTIGLNAAGLPYAAATDPFAEISTDDD